MPPLNKKLKIKLGLIAALTALIAGSFLATGSGEPEPAADHHTTGSVR
ncbi:hypothetical protein [Actinomadura sp. HBU206391]|nr:hypothetical protein [Actinomadura sp. HBU206391]MBC6460136.1 hypothetical protein [Actinomadura sp. HBU206391]